MSSVSDTARIAVDSYDLDAQIGFLLRQAYQRHATIFANLFGDEFTPTQWAVLAKLAQVGECSQNQLGRLTAMDVATIKGVVQRLEKRGHVNLRPDLVDRRRLVVALTHEGRAAFERCAATALGVSDQTLSPLAPGERETLARLLTRLR